MAKTGRMSKDEHKFIEANYNTLSPDTIAAKLERDVGAVLRFMEKHGLSADKKRSYEVQAEYELRDRPYWPDLEIQFSEEELEKFMFHWKQIVSQFRKDILPTEELQIVDVIKLEVLMNRALREQAEMANDIRRMENDLREIESDEVEQRFSMEREIVSLKVARESLNREYRELLKQKTALFEDLKGTRDQRVKTIDGSKKTFAALVNQLITDPDFYEECGHEMEMMRLAAEAEYQRLADYKTYSDGQLDQPLLTPETVE
jgi:hypothetical protein